jgi:hypothetical protein
METLILLGLLALLVGGFLRGAAGELKGRLESEARPGLVWQHSPKGGPPGTERLDEDRLRPGLRRRRLAGAARGAHGFGW